jgi:predicted nuclease of restriction endonuclease-like (RecB) superfamily
VKGKPTSAALTRMPLYDRIRQILESARSSASRSVNTVQVVANWLVGREIVEEEQHGSKRAGYGERVIPDLAARLKSDYGSGYSVPNLKFFRKFYLEYPRLPGDQKGYSVGNLLPAASLLSASGKGYVLRSQSEGDEGNPTRHSPSGKSGVWPISNSWSQESWKPGLLHPNLSWTHYRTLVRVDRPIARSFYEIEAVKNNWAARELERQINSLLFERLAKSKDKAGLMRLARKGQEIQRPEDVFKDPVVMEFLGLPESPRLAESTLETALIDNLQTFLLELGKGFAFVARQQRLTLDGDHFYVDLVFYHTILKCYVLIDLKVGKLNHEDLGQLQLYVNYYDRERRTSGDNPTLGLILCTDKNDAVVQYTLGEEQKEQIFSSRYKLHLPTEDELKAEIRRELRMLGAGGKRRTSPARKRRRTGERLLPG